MSSKITSSVKADLQKFKEEKLRAIKLQVMKVIKDTETQAIDGSPNFIKIDGVIAEDGFSGEVGVLGGGSKYIDTSDVDSLSSEEKLAAYIEFGTGLSASQILAPYPQWVKDIAYEYYVNGKGTLIGKPYLFNNFLKNIETFERDLNNLLEKEFKK